MKDYYSALELNRSASSTEIKSAFRRLSMHLHPDVNGGSRYFEEKFKEINEAYHVLADARKRQAYDIIVWHAAANPQANWQTSTQASAPKPNRQRAVYRRVYRPDIEALRLEREYTRVFWVVTLVISVVVFSGLWAFSHL